MAEAGGRKREQSERTRQGLIDAAAGLFAEKGYGNTSVQAIAQQAGISRGSIFWHSGSKEGLLLAVVEASLRRFEDTLIPLLQVRTGSLRDVVFAFRDYMLRNPPIGRLFYVLLFEGLGPRPQLLKDYARLHQRFRSYVRVWAERAAEAGILPDGIDPDGAGTVLVAVLTGLNLQWQIDPQGVDIGRASETLAALLEKAFAQEGEAAP
ncbi:MAG: TetR/AcrR family transcriptional regulator [Proteobacteria bacterium]|nr:TetR/AcrR family transcriptional regulator [Pseudomonadota bacterium]